MCVELLIHHSFLGWMIRIVENLVEDPSRLVDPFGELEEDVNDEDDAAVENRPSNTPGSPAYTILKGYLDQLCNYYSNVNIRNIFYMVRLYSLLPISYP